MDLEREINELKAIAVVYRKRGQLHLAAEVLTTALMMQETTENTGGQLSSLALTMFQLAEIYSDLNEYSKAKPLYVKAVDLWQVAHPSTEANALHYAEAMMHLQQNHDSSELRLNTRLDGRAERDAA